MRGSSRLSRADRQPHRQAYPDRVEVRGRDLAGDLMGRLTFTEYFHLLLTGDEPTEEQRFFLDLLLVAIAEHGLMPTNVAARMTLAADPGSLQGAVAAGILGAGPVVLGTSEECARLLEDARASGERRARSSREIHASGGKVPGVRPSGARAARSARRADPRARGRARRERAARRARPRLPRRRARGLGQAADDERLDADRRRAARPRLSVHRREGRADPRAHGRPARASGRGAGAADRLRPGARPRRRRSSTSADARAAAVGGAARARRRELSRAARLSARAVGVLPREARRVRGRARGHRASCRSPRRTSSGRRARGRTRSARTSARRRARSSGSTRRAARPESRATSR